MYSGKDRYSKHYMLEVLLGSSKRKIQQGMGRESYTEVLFFYRKIREAPLMRLYLSRVLNEVKE